MIPGTQGYAEAASTLLNKRLAFGDVHAPILRLIPRQPSLILDIGSGPGHDAAAFAGMGHAVVAVEPVAELRSGARERYGEAAIRWMDDSLPLLNAVSALGITYALILLSGVWMHIDASERRAAMPRIAMLLADGGVLALSLRHGPVPKGRRMFQVGAAETIDLAAESGLVPILEIERDSIQPGNRSAGVTWTILAFRQPP